MFLTMENNKKLYNTAKRKETAVLVALASSKQPLLRTQEYLDELAFLAETSGVETLHMFIQKLEKPDSRTFIGKGKLEEITAYVKDKKVDMVIFDDDLSPSQVRNLEAELECKILDRSLLILNIFSVRAQTAQAKTQVELAQYEYMYPRLTRMWSHLSKQQGGIGTRGPGEKELETDRRIVKDRIALLKDKLEKIDKQGITQRKSRDKMVRVALVGYTNVGKSTLMQLLSKSDVFAENKLFATVDSTVRKVVYNRVPFLLTDTVGFIRKLPTTLIESFKSTLDEIREADLLLHVVDSSHPSFEEQIAIVNTTLADIGAADKETVLVFNKIDLLSKEPLEPEQEDPREENTALPVTLEELKATYMNKGTEDTVFISASQQSNIDEFREVLSARVAKIYYTIYPNYLQDQVFTNKTEDI
jgi:GTP-binding protein HflX